MLELKNISKSYSSANEKIEVLKNISLTINDGKITVITGRSGSGKSTLLNIVGAYFHQVKERFLLTELLFMD